MISTLKNLAALVTFYPPVIVIPHQSHAIHLDDVPIFVSFHIYQDFKTKIPELFSIDFSRNHLRLSKSSLPMTLTNDEYTMLSLFVSPKCIKDEQAEIN